MGDEFAQSFQLRKRWLYFGGVVNLWLHRVISRSTFKSNSSLSVLNGNVSRAATNMTILEELSFALFCRENDILTGATWR